jgi:flagellar assembly protein FliH
MPEALARARAAAQAAGYAAGWASGVQAAYRAGETEKQVARDAATRELDERAGQVNAALASVRDAAAEFERRAVPAAERIEELVVSTAFSLAESIVGASLRDDATRGSVALARALALTPAGAPAIVCLNPRDRELLGTTAAELTAGRDVQIVADPSLAPGDATVTTGAISIDARISAGLARAREVLAQ